jgi:hypothetical protein
LIRRPPFDRPPLHDRGAVTFPGFDHRALGPVDRNARAALEHMVVQVAMAGQPDAAGEHRQFTCTVADEGRAARGEAHRGSRGRDRVGLRIHHQSPCEQASIFVAGATVVQ